MKRPIKLRVNVTDIGAIWEYTLDGIEERARLCSYYLRKHVPGLRNGPATMVITDVKPKEDKDYLVIRFRYRYKYTQHVHVRPVGFRRWTKEYLLFNALLWVDRVFEPEVGRDYYVWFLQ